jgi:hypothetical protein
LAKLAVLSDVVGVDMQHGAGGQLFFGLDLLARVSALEGVKVFTVWKWVRRYFVEVVVDDVL